MSKYLRHIFCCFYQKSKTKSKRYKRQSFDERICDDLSEVILQYLSLKNKFRLQCVSNQFQRTIFLYQRRIRVHRYSFQYQKDVLDNLNILKLFDNKNDFDFKSFELFLKKCRNIKAINFRLSLSDANRNQIIQLILKYCNNLTQFVSMPSMLTTNTFEEFKRKYCQSLKSFQDYISVNTQTQLNLYGCFLNIEELSLHLKLDCSHLKLKRLKSLTVFIREEEEINANVLINFGSLRRLTVVLVNFSNLLLQSMKVFIKDMAKLKHLNDLKIINCAEDEIIDQESFHKFLINAVKNCKQLKSFKIDSKISSNNVSIIKELLILLKGIERLNISLDNDMDYNSGEYINELFALKEWKQLTNISHLILNFVYFPPLNECFMNEILKTIPNIQYLDFYIVFTTDSNGSAQMADNLSRLSRLETLKLFLSNELICNQIKAKVIEKCKKIRIIDILVKEMSE